MFMWLAKAITLISLLGLSYAAGPTITPVYPRSGELGISVTRDVLIKLFNVSGSNYSVKINGVDAIISGAPVNGFHYGSVPVGTGIQINIAHAVFAYDSLNTLYVAAVNSAGTTTTMSYTFTTVPAPVVVDTIAPAIIAVDPLEASTNVALTIPLKLRLTDNTQIDWSSLCITINGLAVVINGTAQPGYSVFPTSTTLGDLSLTLEHTNPWLSAVQYAVQVAIKDIVGNATGKTYAFSTGASVDSTPPVVQAIAPVDTATDISILAPLTINVTDDSSGISYNSISIMLNGTYAIISGNAQPGYTVNVISNGLAKTLVITHPQFFYNTQYTVWTVVQDKTGNATSYASTFRTIAEPDVTVPGISPQYPTQGLNNMSLTGPFLMHFWDDLSGVDMTGLNITLNNLAIVKNGIAQSGYGLTVTTNSALDKDIAVTHPQLVYATSYTLDIGIRDVSGNLATRTLTFSTPGAPDTIAPVVTAVAPAHASNNVSTSAPVVVTISDDLSGVSLNSVSIMLGGTYAVVSGSAQTGYGLNIATNGLTKTYTITHPVLWYDTAYSIWTVAKDVSGNSVSYTSTFNTIAEPATTNPTTNVLVPTDNVPPSIINESPVSGSINISTNSVIAFDVTDNMSGVSINSLYMELNGTAIINHSQVITPSEYIVTTSNSAGIFHVSVQPLTPLLYNERYYIRASIGDVSNNWQVYRYSFTTTAPPAVIPTDNTAPIMTPIMPLSGQNNFSVNNPIALSLQDMGSGISINTLHISINEIAVKLYGNVAQDQFYTTPSGNADLSLVNIIIEHGTTLNYATTYTVAVTCQDISANTLTTAYVFTTEQAPTTGITDITAPSIFFITPTENAVGVGVREALVITVTDNTALDFNSLNVLVNGEGAFIVQGVPATAVAVTFNAHSFTVTINPDVSFNYGATQTIAIAIADIYGNTTTCSRIFTTKLAPPTITVTGSTQAEITINTRTISVCGETAPSAKVLLYVVGVPQALAQAFADGQGKYSATIVLPRTGYQQLYALAQDLSNNNVSYPSLLCGFNPNNKQLLIAGVMGSKRGMLSAEVNMPIEAISYEVETVIMTPITRNITDTRYKKHLLPFQLNLKLPGVATTVAAVNFAVPVTVTLNFELALSENTLSTLAIYYNAQGLWKKDGIEMLRVSKNYVVFTTTHFTEFSLIDIAADITVASNSTGTYVAPNPVDFSKQNAFFIYDMGERNHGTVQIRVYDLAGNLLWKHVSDVDQAQGSIVWTGQTDTGQVLANGPYISFIIMTDGSWKKVQRLPLAVIK